MSPVWMFEGERELDPVRRAKPRRAALGRAAAAVHEHEARVRKQLPGMRSCDAALYRRLRHIVSAEPTVLPEPDARIGGA